MGGWNPPERPSAGIPSYDNSSLWADFLEGDEDKRAVVDAGVGEGEAGILEFHFSEEEDVDVDDAGRVADGIALAAQSQFERLSFFQ